ncbi:MAG: hypothetical protein AAB925_00050 [Patescibacteria group bacterium]
MAKKEITTNDLALMIGKGFAGVDENFKKVDENFKKVNQRLDKLEYLLSSDYKKRLEKAEEDIKELKGLLAV